MVSAMSTLSEIEAAVDRLPLAEQEQLLRHLDQKVHSRKSTTGGSPEQWMRRLDEHRKSMGTNGSRSMRPTQQLLDELREDRI
jgi:hypothetical protein